MKTRDFDRRFDEGEDIAQQVDWSKARRPNAELKRVNVDVPTWVVAALDRQLKRPGVTRPAPIKLWIAERLG